MQVAGPRAPTEAANSWQPTAIIYSLIPTMADRDSRWPENAPGKYYVDETCIAAKFCLGAAPNNFHMEAGHACLSRQPESPEEETRVQEALGGCPVSAIGDDGD